MKPTASVYIKDNVAYCRDCGAFAATVEALKHHKKCRPGATEKWLESLRAASKRYTRSR